MSQALCDSMSQSGIAGNLIWVGPVECGAFAFLVCQLWVYNCCRFYVETEVGRVRRIWLDRPQLAKVMMEDDLHKEQYK